jgi:hypothetical protein
MGTNETRPISFQALFRAVWHSVRMVMAAFLLGAFHESVVSFCEEDDD